MLKKQSSNFVFYGIIGDEYNHMQINSNNYKKLTLFALILIGLSGLIAYAFFIFLGDKFAKLPVWVQLIASFPSVPAVYAVFFFLFDRIFWKSKIFKYLGVIVTDNLNGVWEGEMRSSWDNFQSSIPTELKIRQTATTIKVCGKFNQSRSISIHEYFGRNDTHDQTALYYFYKNDPNYDAPATMAMHEGSTILMHNKEENSLTGYYYSGRDRNNHGTIKVFKKVE